MVCGFSPSGSLRVCAEWPHCLCGVAKAAPQRPIDIGLHADLRIAEAMQRLHATIDLKCKRERMRDAARKTGEAAVELSANVDAFHAAMKRARDRVEDLRQAMIDEMLAGKW